MRVITGSVRGKKLEAVPGEETRPTSDRIKESIFNIIQFDLEGRTVLDLFAGTGQLGIEALSRGAKRAFFVEMSRAALEVTRRNLAHTGFSERSQTVGGEALQFIGGTREKFDIIFLDPPYGSALMEKALRKISEFDILRTGGIIVCECGLKESLPELDKPYTAGKRYEYGGKSVAIYTRIEEGT